MKTKVLLFARSFLAEYYSDIDSDIIEPIFVTMTVHEKEFLQKKGWKVYGCFEEEYESLQIADYPSNYLKTSFASDRFLKRFSYEKRLEILGKEISFWKRIFDETAPAALFNETVAVEIAEVMAIEAEKRSVPFFTSLLGFLPNTFYWKPDPFTGRLNDLSGIVPCEDDFKKADEYIENVTKKSQVPFYVKSYLGKPNKSFTSFVKKTAFNSVYYVREKRLQHKRGFRYEDYSSFSFNYTRYYIRSIFHKYDDIAKTKDISFVYFPLHMEPEATLSYFVNQNYRQDFLVDSVVKSLRQGQYLVVKEHPQQPGLLLEPRYRYLKKYYPNLIYLPSNVPSYGILKNCECIITLTSSAAWEGLLLKKPVLVIGKIFYDQCPGALRINNINELKDILRNNHFSSISDGELRLFVGRMISLFQTGCPSPLAKNAGLTEYVKAMEICISKLIGNH